MAPPYRPRRLGFNEVADRFPAKKAIVFSETQRPSPTLVPNVRSPAWNPTGSMLAHSMTTNIRVWNPERPDIRASTEMKDAHSVGTTTGKTSTAYAHDGKTVEKVQFNPRTEGLLASTAQDGVVKLWDVRLPGGGTGLAGGPVGGAAGKGGITPKAGEHRLTDARGMFLNWHPDGKQLLSGTHSDSIAVLDVRKIDNALLEIPSNPASNNSANLKYELDATDHSSIKPLDPSGGKAKWFFGPMIFTHAGTELIATSTEGPVYIFSYPDMQHIHTITAHTSATYSVAQSPAGTTLAVGSADSLVTLWDTTTLQANHVLMNYTTAVRDISFSFDGQYLVAGHGHDGQKDGDKGLHIYHTDTGECVHTAETNNPVRDVAWHPLRYAVAYSGDPGGLKVVGGLTG
ncbi:WD repeat-containing [Lecanosticta acicola]|uniref:WD repeat-containing n=1 Tax=Lecanosticta acicola TaxID=111012 RepID=A0AAI8YXS9_9PEZI|nr:WD repeat-containing [Lecanosticta acicola]